MTEEEAMSRLLRALAARDGLDRMYEHGYNAIKGYVNSPVAFTNIERLDRIRAVIEAVEAVRAERG